LVAALRPYAPVAVHASPARRCIDTVAPLARALGRDVVVLDELYEGMGLAVLPQIRAAAGTTVWCSHGDVLDDLLDAFGVRERPRFKKAAAFVIDGDEARYVRPPA
jgi:phosphohistidine phosphatase SixA